MSGPTVPKLSFCITTFNRAGLIGATLESIISQATTECEIVVTDGGSTDDTAKVIANYAARFPELRYIQQQKNTGMDEGFDCAVEMARGEYCWLLSSKDLLQPGAVATVLAHLRKDPSVVVVNMEIRDSSLETILIPRSVVFDSDVVYGPDQGDRLFTDAHNLINHVSCSIIKRSIWLEREKARYYGSLRLITAVLFQHPLPGNAILVAQPLLCHRFGGQSWLGHALRWRLMWSPMVESFALSDQTKSMFAGSHPIQRLQYLLFLRACGLFTWRGYRQFAYDHPDLSRGLPMPRIIASLPGRLLNTILVSQTRRSRSPYRTITLQALRASRFYVPNLDFGGTV